MFGLIIVLVFSVFVLGVKVGITQIVDHPALNALTQGVIDVLNSFDSSVEIEIQNAQGVFQNTINIAKKFKTDVDFIVAVSTPSAQSCQTEIKDKPIIFSAVTDPVSAGLVSHMGKNSGNITGISDMLPVGVHLGLIKKLIPTAKKIGIVYNPGESNSVALAELTKSYSKSLDFEIVDMTGSNVNELITAYNSKRDLVDTVYLFTDNLVASSGEILGKLFEKDNMPVIAGDISIAKSTSFIGFGFDYYKLGTETGKMLVEIIKGKKVQDTESQFMSSDSLSLFINMKKAKNLGINIPAELIKKADEVVE